MSVPNVLVNIGYALPESEIARRTNLNPKYKRERAYYSCRQTEDFLKYVDRGIAEGDVVGYTGNPEKSSGVFDINGLLSSDRKKKLREKLRRTKSNIWHAVISFTEEFGEEHMKSSEDARALLIAELPRFLKSAGFEPENVNWFAGLHENTDNRHIHLSFFEKEPQFYTARSKEPRYHYGKLRLTAIENFVVHIEERLTDALFELKQSRREVTETEKEVLGQATADPTLKRKLLALYRQLPTEGRVGYASRNMDEVRPLVKDIVREIIAENPELKLRCAKFSKALVEHDDRVLEMCARQKIKDPSRFLTEYKYLDDLYRRMGDQVIKTAIRIKRKEEYAKKRCKIQLSKKRVERRHRAFLFEKSEQIARDVDDEAMRAMEEYQDKLAHAEIARLIEEGILEP